MSSRRTRNDTRGALRSLERVIRSQGAEIKLLRIAVQQLTKIISIEYAKSYTITSETVEDWTDYEKLGEEIAAQRRAALAAAKELGIREGKREDWKDT